MMTAKVNGINPQAWLADVLAGIAGTPSYQAGPTASMELDTARHRRPSGITCGLRPGRKAES
jgi:hypothetical protein